MKKNLNIYIFFIKFYKVFLSPHFGGACRFYPTCSCYAEKAFSSKPPLKAFFLVLIRLSKCRFFGPYGLDPLPPVKGVLNPPAPVKGVLNPPVKKTLSFSKERKEAKEQG